LNKIFVFLKNLINKENYKSLVRIKLNNNKILINQS